LNLSLLERASFSDERASRPFTHNPGFNERWWLGDAKGPLVFCSFTTDACGEVARAQIRPRSTLGVAYPTYTRPRLGSTEVDRLEVRTDLQGQGVGREVIARLLVEFPRPCIALSLNMRSDRFWRSIGWAEHPHPDGPRGASLFVEPN
jgi:GNAT superfamily N-acetyltransferase